MEELIEKLLKERNEYKKLYEQMKELYDDAVKKCECDN